MEENKNYALITGASEGIGYELAKLFASDGYNLVIVARNNDELENRAAEFSQQGVEVIVIAKDLFKREEAFASFTLSNMLTSCLILKSPILSIKSIDE